MTRPHTTHPTRTARRSRPRLRLDRLEDRTVPAGWAFGLSGPELDSGNGIAVDGDGNVYVAGSFRATADFDPSPSGTAALSSRGDSDMYLAKYTTQGALAWARRVGGTGWENGQNVAVDAAGNAYLKGTFRSSQIDITGTGGDVGPSLTKGERDRFGLVVKFDSDGEAIWVRPFGGTGDVTESSSQSSGLAVGLDGSVYVTGSWYAGTVDFDLTRTHAGNADILTETSNMAVAKDAYVARYAANGDFRWARQVDGPSAAGGSDIAVDADGNAYVVGHFGGLTAGLTATFGPDTLTDHGGGDAFVTRLDADGTFRWARRAGGPDISGRDWFHGVQVHRDPVSGAESVYLAGSFRSAAGPADFGAEQLTGFGSSDVVVAKVSTDGDFVWARQLGGADVDYAHIGLAVDAGGNVYTVINSRGTADFDPGPGAALLGSTGAVVCVSKLDALGNYVGARQVGELAADDGSNLGDIAVDGNGFVYLTETFLPGMFTVDTGTGTVTLTNTGESDTWDAYVVKTDASRGSVFGQVRTARTSDGALVPVVGTTVTLNGDGLSLSVAAGRLGEFHFQNLPDGEYTLTAGGASRTVTVSAGQSITGQDFTLAVPTTIKTVTNSTAKAIADAKASGPSTTTSTLAVAQAPSRIFDLDVTLTITHPNTADLSVTLIAPGGLRVPLVAGVGGTGFSNTVLDDDAPTPLAAGAAPYTGRFRPPAPLLYLVNGLPANGTWTLDVVDSVRGNAGTLQSWSLAFTGEAGRASAPPQITIGDAAVKEGHGGSKMFVFTVSLSAPSSQSVTLSYATADGTATSGSDYQAQSGAITFAPGETTKTISVIVYGDKAKEGDETFFVNLFGAANADILDGSGLGTILTDD